MTDESFPNAPSDGSYGILIGRWQRRVGFKGLLRATKRGAMRVSGLVWTPESNRVLPVWDHHILLEAVWSASRRFWLGVSFVIAGLLASVVVLSRPSHDLSIEEDGTLAYFMDVLTCTLLMTLSGWQVHRTFSKSPAYVDCAREWHRFNAFARIRSGWWVECFVVALLTVFFCQLRAAHAIGPDGKSIATLKLAQSFELVVGQGQWWRVFTSSLVHNGPEHLLSVVIPMLFYGRWMGAVAPRGVLPLVLALGAWISMPCALFDTLDYPGVGFSGALAALVGFLIVTWLRTEALPPFLGPALCALQFLSTVNDLFSRSTVSAAGHAGGFLIGFILGMLLVRPGAQLPITTHRFVNFAGHACGVIMLALCVLVSLNLSNVSWAQW